jgi:phosphatidylserine/phosphatidylglycerophosphate/cardiolipin synthase-like enzyme
VTRPDLRRIAQTTPRQASPSRGVRSVLILASLMLLTACGGPSLGRQADGTAACLRSLPAAPVATGVFVQPDDGREPVLDEIEAAQCAIDISVHLLSDDDLIDALAGAVERGVRVRVMLEEHPFGGGGSVDEDAEALREGGVEVRWSGSSVRFSHAKFAIVDRQVALVMNQNLTTASFNGNREFGAVTSDPTRVAVVQDVFDKDWAGRETDDPPPPFIASPDNSRTRFLDLIDDAERSIDFYAEVIRDEEFVRAIGAAERRGVAVRLIVDETLDEDDQAIAAALDRSGVEIRLSSDLYIHAKLMVIDRSVAIVGSQNFTATSLDENRELAIVLDDATSLERCLAVYERDWTRSAPASPA